MKRLAVAGTGMYVPAEVLSNGDLEKFLDTTDEWIFTRTGIRERRRAAPGETSATMAFEAANKALEAASLSPADLDLILVSTITPDTHCPAAACWLQGMLKASKALAFDITAACSGFIYGLETARHYFHSGKYRNILLASSEVMTRTVDWSDRESCILWGDGAGAVVLRESENGEGILSTHLYSDGSFAGMLQLPGGGSATSPISHESVDKNLHTLRMEGKKTFKMAVKAFTDAGREALDANGLSLSDVRWMIPHQANRRIIQAVAEQINLPMERVYLTIEKYGNISSATIPIALDEAVRGGGVSKGDRLLLVAFGGGLTWGSSVISW